MASPVLDLATEAADWRDPSVRLAALLDPGSPRPLAPMDNSGVYAVQGTVAGARVVAYATDPQKMGGAMGSEGCRHIVDAIDTAVASGCRWSACGTPAGPAGRWGRALDAGRASSSPRWFSASGWCLSCRSCSARPRARVRAALTDIVVMGRASVFVTYRTWSARCPVRTRQGVLGGRTRTAGASGVVHGVAPSDAERWSTAC